MYRERLTAIASIRVWSAWRVGLATVAVSALVGGAGSASAFVIDSSTQVNDMFTVPFELQVGETDDAGNTLTQGSDPLSATIKYTATSIDLSANGSVTFSIDISNTTSLGFNDTILSFGFFSDPDVSVSNFTAGTTFDALVEDTNFPGFQTIDVCILSSNNCSGGSINDGLAPGASDTVEVVLSGDLSGGSLIIDPSVVKFQGDRGSFEFDGDNGDDPTPTPEPATLALIGTGLAGLGWLSRRRRTQA